MTKESWLRASVIGIGLIITALLFFANKTNLDSSTEVQLRSTTSTATSSSSNLPPLAPEPMLNSWIDSLNLVKGSKKIRILDSIIVNLQARKRFAYAADYADQLVSLDSSFKNILLAGELSQKSLNLPYVQQDTALRRTYAQRSINYLEQVIDKQPENERALLALGLAYAQSGIPQMSMQGIMTIRKVLDINPDNVEASFQLGVFSVQTGQFDKAVQRFEKVISLDPENYPALYELARSQYQLGNVDSARQHLQHVIQQTPDPNLRQAANVLLNQIN